MRRVERELQALQAHPPAAPAPIETIYRRGRILRWRRRAVTAVAIAAVMSAAIVVPLVAFEGSGQDPVVIAGPSAASGGGRPGIYAVTSALDLVAIGPGSTQRVITRLDRFDDFERPIDVAPDHSFAYVTEGQGDPVMCDAIIRRFRIADGTGGEIVARGDSPAASPDERELAYIERSPRSGGASGCAATLVVRDLMTGSERRWVDAVETLQGPGAEARPARLHSLVWSPDGRELAFSRSSAEIDRTYVFDLASAARTLEAREINPGIGPGWMVVGWSPVGDLIVRSTCKFTAAECSGEQSTVVAIDDAISGFTELGDVPDDLSSVWLDPGGTQLLYVVGDGRHGTLGTLYRQPLGASPIELARDVLAAVWVRNAGPAAPSPRVEERTVPDVSDLTPSEARRRLEGDGLSVDVQYRTDSGSPGRILEQQPPPGTEVAEGVGAVLVVGAFQPCGGFFSPTDLPPGFDGESRAGPAPEADRHAIPVSDAVVHYTDGSGRSIEIRRRATPYLEILARDDEKPDAYVIGQAVLIRPIAPTLRTPLLAHFYFPEQGDPDDPCGSYSINGYGVTKQEMRTFAEGLAPVP